jgi:hypothetical protein
MKWERSKGEKEEIQMKKVCFFWEYHMNIYKLTLGPIPSWIGNLQNRFAHDFFASWNGMNQWHSTWTWFTQGFDPLDLHNKQATEWLMMGTLP